MKRGLIGVVLASLVGLDVVESAAADFPEVKAQGKLRILSAAPGESYIALTSGGQVVGLEGELLRSFAQLHRLALEIVEVKGWDLLIPALLEGKGDLVAGNLTDTAQRRERVHFTAQVLPTRLVVVTRRPHAIIRTLDEFRRERVGTIRGTSMADAIIAAGVPRSNIDDTLPQDARISARLGSAAFTAAVEEVAVAMLLARADPELQLGMFLGPAGSLAWAVRKEDVQLRQALNDYIGNARRTATWSRLVVKYYGEPALEILRSARGE
ncbi:MAG TPA: transporter substrate-binding domain-containing protein [Vicinamibacteria bacterium]|nr:transporter substrate-binding domain-containing protein [Vicinamibacteria bacterium]